MTASTDIYRVRRPLTAVELDLIRAGIDTATDTTGVLVAIVAGVFDALLHDLGESYHDHGPDRRIDPRRYAIPQTQWLAIADAATNHAHSNGVSIGLDLVNLMPAAYDDPSVPAPHLTTGDHRPQVLQLEISRQATEEIAACERHLQQLAAYYGPVSDIYRQALTSWHQQLAGLFGTALGATTVVHRDGPLSLQVSTASGLVFGVIFHGDHRICLTPGCHAESSTDAPGDTAPVVWWPRYHGADVLDHEHVPSRPVDAPQPGTWSFHS